MPATNLTTLFTDIADAIREKDGSSGTIQASTFPARIEAIPSGGGGKVSVSVTGNASYLDLDGQWDDLFNNSNVELSFTGITNLQSAFSGSSLTEIDLSDMTFSADSVTSITQCFRNCNMVERISIPNLRTVTNHGNSTFVFQNCYKLREINMPLFNALGGSNMFNGCYSLREIPWILSGATLGVNANIYNAGFYYCYTLNKILDLGVPSSTLGTNAFTNTFSSCSRLARLTFDTDNGTPKTLNWRNQTIDLTQYVGYVTNDNVIRNYNSGITTAKKVTDVTSYEALKNDPDWYTLDVAYSRYNHDSAAETINSLPDTSAYLAQVGGTNTIKFKGTSGSATDGGAISDLTTEEIAVATAKGWTVSIV